MYLMSIVIPTRNRQLYCYETLKQVLNSTSSDVQIVITDNSDDCTLEKKIKDLGIQRIKYEYIKNRIPGVDNYARGISLSDSEYVCCIGDDDGILPNIMPIVQWMKERNIEALKPGVQATFYWPGSAKEYESGCAGLKTVTENVKIVNPKLELLNFMENGILDFPNANLVKAYHGIVRKDKFDQIRTITGKYCGGLSPDIYLSVALSIVTESLYCIDIPISIFGACKSSTTGDSLNKINIGKLEDAPHFIGQPYEWSSLVPRYYCGSNIWADSALHAASDMKQENLVHIFGLHIFSGYSIVYNYKYRNEILLNYKQNNGEYKKLISEVVKNIPPYLISGFKGFVRKQKYLIDFYRRIRDRKQRKAGKEEFVKTNVKDISVASSLISEVVNNHTNSILMNLNVLVKNNEN